MNGIPNIALIFIFAGTLAEGQDPCEMRTVIRDQYERSAGYVSDPTGDLLCDRYKQEGWYEFKAGSGNEIPEMEVQIQRCGTHYPIWLNGNHPSVPDGEVTRTACMTGTSSGCEIEYDIKIKNCTGYYVYYLVRPEYCNQAYCVGTEVKCPEGESSETGFTPGCTKDGFPVFYNDPTITYEIEEIITETGVILQAVVMLCDIQHNETDIAIDVYWYMGETLIEEYVKENSILYKDFPAKLREEDWMEKATLDKDVICRLRPRYTKESVPGDARETSYYMGMVVEETILEVVEGGDPAQYTFYPTIPILCPKDFPTCELMIEVYEPFIDGAVATCPDRRRLKQTGVEFKHSNCTVGIPQILAPSPSDKISLAIFAGNDQVYDNDALVHLVIRSITLHYHHKIWQNYHFPVAQVRVIEKDDEVGDAYCRASNDPHMTTFDGRKYDNMKEGEFIMYRHKTLPIEVQAYYQKVSDYSKVCGAAIRSGGDLWIYDTCREGKSARIRAYECEDMTLRIEQSGSEYKVHLPTGGHVRITNSVIDIIPSLADIEETMGLCGTFDHDCTNDFLTREGSYPEGSELGCDQTGDDEFSESWRIHEGDGESLYEGEIRNENPFDEYYFCSCVEDKDTGEYQTICAKHKGLDFCVATGDDVTDEFYEWCTDVNKKQRSLAAYGDDVEEPVERPQWDESFNPPEPEWSGNWTEEAAREHCIKFIMENSVIETCISLINLDTEAALDLCVQDIKITGETGFSRVHLSNLLSACYYEVARNNSKFTFSNDSGVETLEPPIELEQMCPEDCSGRGTCQDGKCHCDTGYFGDDCYYDENKVPHLFDMQFEGLCDLQTRPCASTPVYGDYFLRKPTLSCRIKPIILTTNGDKIPLAEHTVLAKYSHFQRILCPLPLVSINYDVTDYFTIGYDISASNDRQQFSNVRAMTVLDSQCMNCTAELECVQEANTCVYAGFCYNPGEAPDPQRSCFVCDAQNGIVLKSQTCYIASSCYATGDTNPSDNCYYCDPNTSTTEWTKVENDACTNKSNAGLIAGSVILLVAIMTVLAMVGMFLYRHHRIHPAKQEDNIGMGERNDMDT